MAKIRKTFKDFYELSEVVNSVDALLDYYGNETKLGDIFTNATENLRKWQVCDNCNGAGVVSNESCKLVGCKVCKGVGHIRIKNLKGDT